MAWETLGTTSDRQEMDDMTAGTTTPIVPFGGTQSLAGSPTYDAYANTQMGRLSRIVALHAGVSEPSTSQMLAERLAESARKALEAASPLAPLDAGLERVRSRLPEVVDYPGDIVEGPRGRAGSPKAPRLPDGWLDSPVLDEAHREMLSQAESDVSVSGG